MARILLVYYSWSGNTRRIAEELMRVGSWDAEKIRESAPRAGLGGYVRCVLDSLLRRQPALVPLRLDARAYDCVVIGGPVWAGRIAGPVRSYAADAGARARQVAFFCTQDKSGAEAAFAELAALCGKAPCTTLAIDSAHLPAAAHRDLLPQFIATVASACGQAVPPQKEASA